MTTETSENSVLENPLDLIEELITVNQWSVDRYASDEMLAIARGQWSEYRLFFLWRDDLNALYFSAQFDFGVPVENRAAVYELLARINEKLWMGHFELCHDDGALMFRQTCLMRGQWAVTEEQIEDLIEITLAECDRFYPAFLYVLQQAAGAEQALALSLVDVAGVA
jgi:hypothetical protein